MKGASKKSLPKAGVVTAVILAVLLILFIGAYGKKGAFSQINLFGSNETLVQSQSIDSDNDGLKDWQENLYRTDANNPDTDGDGYLDGEEIDSGHNPLVKSPGDTNLFYPLPLGDKYNITKKVLSDQNIDTLFASYLSQKQDYLDSNPLIGSQEAFSAMVNPSTIDEMAKRALGDLYAVLTDQAREELAQIPDLFNIAITDNNIKISQDNDKATIEKYLGQVSYILNTDNFFIREQAYQALTKTFNEGDFSQLDELIKTNDAKIEDAKTIIVPSTWKDVHKRGLELTLLIRNIYAGFRDVLDDPLKAYMAIDKLENFSQNWNELIDQAINLAASQGITITLQK